MSVKLQSALREIGKIIYLEVCEGKALIYWLSYFRQRMLLSSANISQSPYTTVTAISRLLDFIPAISPLKSSQLTPHPSQALSLPFAPLPSIYSQSKGLFIARPSITDRAMHKHCGLSAELSHITIIIMSNKATKCLLARSPLASDLLLTATHSPLTYAHHTRLLDDNLQALMMKYPHLSEQKVKDLLEELDNNCQLAMQILDEEEQRCRQIVEETAPIKKPTPTPAEQNRILKQSFLSLYKKLLAKTQELQQLQAKYEAQKSENGRLREMNRMLLQGEYAEEALQDLTPIC